MHREDRISYWIFETLSQLALRAKILELFMQHLADDAHQVGGITQVSIVQHEPYTINVWVLEVAVDAVGVERTGSALDPLGFVPLIQQQLDQVGSNLVGYAGDQCAFGGSHRFPRFLF